MYWFRMGHMADLPWLTQAAVSGAWESLPLDERQAVAPGAVATYVSQQLVEFLTGPGGVAIVAVQGGMPVGFVAGAAAPDTSTEEMHGHILTVWVAPAHRRHGLAGRLLSLSEQYFGRLGLRKVKIWAPVSNQTAVRLARRSGYEPEGLIGLKRLQSGPRMHVSDTVT